ncbi:MAG: hypothetical protein ABSC77_00970 [Terracidiphilus sp.]|jgi:hypothetical protein
MKEFPAMHRELLYVLLFLVTFLVFNASTATLYPYPHIDETTFAEPAIAYLHGQGFGIHHFPQNFSLYSFLLVPWIQLFGFSMRSVRSAEVFFMTATFGIVWSAVMRFNFVSRFSYRILMLFLLATEFGILVSCRIGRYDGFGACLFSLLFWSMSVKRPILRLTLLFAICLFLPWAGLQYLPVLFTAGAVLFMFFRGCYWKEIMTSFLGAGVGGAGLISALFVSGRLPEYLHFIHTQKYLGLKMLAVWFRSGHLEHSNIIPVDYSLPFLLAAAVVLAIYLLRQKIIQWRSVLPFTLAYCALLFCILLVSSKFPTYYSYMVTIPLAVAVCHGLSLCRSNSVKYAAWMLCFLCASAGVGINAAVYADNWQDRSYNRVEKFVSSVVRADDIAFVDYAPYYAARMKTRDVFSPIPDWDIFQLMSAEQRNSITVVLVRPEKVEMAIRGLGGAWYPTGDKLAPSKIGLFEGKGLGFISLPDNQIQVFRRR